MDTLYIIKSISLPATAYNVFQQSQQRPLPPVKLIVQVLNIFNNIQHCGRSKKSPAIANRGFDSQRENNFKNSFMSNVRPDPTPLFDPTPLLTPPPSCSVLLSHRCIQHRRYSGFIRAHNSWVVWGTRRHADK